MRLTPIPLVCAFLISGSCPIRARGDGGTLRFSEAKGGYLVSVFTLPAPFRAGIVDISVLVQEAETGAPVPQAQVTVVMSRPDQAPLAYAATSTAATNKLMRAAQFELPTSGSWALSVHVEGPHGAVEFGWELEAAEPMPRWRELWPWLGLPGFALVLFAVHRLFVTRRQGVRA
jgi:hypothetical protein